MSTTIELTDELVLHLRTLLFEDLHERGDYLAKAAHTAHEGPMATDGDTAESCWRACGLQETAALLYLIGWDTAPEAERLRAVKEAP